MPTVKVAVPHDKDPEEIVKNAQSVIEKSVQDFDGHDLSLKWTGRQADYHFKSMGFTVNGRMDVQDDQLVVEVDLPFAAMMFKDRVEKGIAKNISKALELG